jgi:microcystin degradation protein MlrC
VLCLINDADSAKTCHAAGQGASVSLSLGGKSDGAPFACTATVKKLTDGRFTLTGPMGAGNPADLGPCALIEIGPGATGTTRARRSLSIRSMPFPPMAAETAVRANAVKAVA